MLIPSEEIMAEKANVEKQAQVGWDGEDSALLQVAVCETLAGWIGWGLSPWGLVALNYPAASREEAKTRLRRLFPSAKEREDATSSALCDHLQAYFEGKTVMFDVTLDLSRFTPFQQRVWEATLTIPYGETRSYAWVAEACETPRAYRAVGHALAINPIPIVVPCHRVLRSNGQLGGYGGGTAMKQHLLTIETGLSAEQVKELWRAAPWQT